MKILKVKGLTKNEVELRNHIFFNELGGECNYEDPYEGGDGFEWHFSYGVSMKKGVMENWAKGLGWDNNFCKGVFGSLISKDVFYITEPQDVMSGVPYDVITTNSAEAYVDSSCGWYDYDLEGKVYKWEVA
mgnify:CR=1 FL=1